MKMETVYWHWWDAAKQKTFLIGKFIAINAYIKQVEISQINRLILHLKELEKEE